MNIRQCCFFVIFFLMILASGSFADPIVPQPNTLGIYFDEEATQVCAQNPGEPFDIYIILTNPTFGEIQGYAWGIEVPQESVYFLACYFSGEYGIGDPGPWLPDVLIGLGEPLICSQVTILCRSSIFVLTDDPVSFVLHGSSYSSVPGDLPEVWRMDGSLFQLNLAVQQGQPCLQINGECGIVAEEQQTWDQVKALFLLSN